MFIIPILSSGGVISGTPDTVATYTGLSIDATNDVGTVTSGVFSLNVLRPADGDLVPDGQINAADLLIAEESCLD